MIYLTSSGTYAGEHSPLTSLLSSMTAKCQKTSIRALLTKRRIEDNVSADNKRRKVVQNPTPNEEYKMLDGEEHGFFLEATKMFATELTGLATERCAPVSIPGIIASIITKMPKAMFTNHRVHLNKTGITKKSSRK